ncbi:MAG: hypothetical protein RLZZ200_76 [Pseudomonadota bacterium]|jgi:CheY-like chemotaxis protein
MPDGAATPIAESDSAAAAVLCRLLGILAIAVCLIAAMLLKTQASLAFVPFMGLLYGILKPFQHWPVATILMTLAVPLAIIRLGDDSAHALPYALSGVLLYLLSAWLTCQLQTPPSETAADAASPDRASRDALPWASGSLQPLIDDVLDFIQTNAELLKLNWLHMYLRALLQELARYQRSKSLDKGLQFEFALDSGLPDRVHGVSCRNSQVTHNLLDDTINFMSSGLLSLEAGWLPTQRNNNQGTLVDREHDAGSGIPADSTVPESRDDKPESELPKGTAALSGLRILLAEDDPDNQFVARLLLESLGAVVDAVDDGMAAVERCRASPGDYDVGLLDVRMPRLDGLGAARLIRATSGCATLPLVALTANASPVDREACIAAGLDAFLPKPLDRMNLIRTLLEVCGRKAELQTGGDGIAREVDLSVRPSRGFDLAAALQRIDQNWQIYDAMATRFLDTYEERFRKLRQAWSAARVEDLHLLLHSFRGSALSLGAVVLAGRLHDVQEGLRRTAPDPGTTLPAALAEALSETRLELVALLHSRLQVHQESAPKW